MSLAPTTRLDLTEMWTALLASGWNCLAVVPTDSGVSLQDVVEVLNTSSESCAPPVRCIDTRGVDIAEAKRLAGKLPGSAPDDGGRTVIILDPLTSSLAGVHLLQKVDAVLLVIRVASFDVESLTSTVTMVGSGRIVGAVTASAMGS